MIVKRVIPFLLALLTVNSLHATIIRVEKSGTVDQVVDTGGLLGDLVSVGQPFTVWYEFDTSAPDLYPETHWVGQYAGIRSGLTLPRFSEQGDARVQVVTVNGGWLVFGGTSMNWSFRSDLFLMTSPLVNDAFPWPIPPFQAIPLGAMFLHGEPKGESFRGNVTSVSIFAVPEPALPAGLLVSSALFLRRRSRVGRVLSS